MAKRIKRVFKVREIAHLWAAFNRGDNTLDWARSGAEYEGARYSGPLFYSEGDLCARQCTAKSKARYVLQIPGRKNQVAHVVGAKNGRLIELPHGAIGHRYTNTVGEFSNVYVFSAGDLTLFLPDIVKALIKGGTLRYVTEARWLAEQERLSFSALLKEVLDADAVAMADTDARMHRSAQDRMERLKREQEEAAQRAADARNPLVRALCGVSQAAMECDRQGRQIMVNTLAWTADLYWLFGEGSSRGAHYRRNIPTLLRVRGNLIHTSQGASFPAEHGLAAWQFILRAFQTREPWYPEATTGAALGRHKIDCVDENGLVYAGCHQVPFWSVAYAKAQLSGCAPSEAMEWAHAVATREG